MVTVHLIKGLAVKSSSIISDLKVLVYMKLLLVEPHILTLPAVHLYYLLYVLPLICEGIGASDASVSLS